MTKYLSQAGVTTLWSKIKSYVSGQVADLKNYMFSSYMPRAISSSFAPVQDFSSSSPKPGGIPRFSSLSASLTPNYASNNNERGPIAIFDMYNQIFGLDYQFLTKNYGYSINGKQPYLLAINPSSCPVSYEVASSIYPSASSIPTGQAVNAQLSAYAKKTDLNSYVLQSALTQTLSNYVQGNVTVFAADSDLTKVSSVSIGSFPIDRTLINQGKALCYLVTTSAPYLCIPLAISYSVSGVVTFSGFIHNALDSFILLRFTSLTSTSLGTPIIYKSTFSNSVPYNASLGDFNESFPIPIELIIPENDTESTEVEAENNNQQEL